MQDLLFALIPTLSTAAFVWLWRKAKVERSLAENQMAAAKLELASTEKVATALRDIVMKRNAEIERLREKLPAAAQLDDFFDGLPRRDPGTNDN